VKLLLDTNTISYLLRKRTPTIDRYEAAVQSGSTFLLSPIVHYELVRYFALKGADRLARGYELMRSGWSRCHFGFAEWEAAGLLWAERHRAGNAMSDMDLLIAITARQEGAVIVTGNVRHFEGLGMPLQDWTIAAT
jgi:predicted nucleic acid-binding protein